MTLTVSRLRKRHEHIASFMCSVSKSDILVDWYKDEHELYPSDKYEFVEAECVHGLIIHDLCMADYGSYCVVIGRKRNMHGDHLTMGEAPVQFIIPLEEATVLEGESVTFTCETTDEMAPAKWYKDGKEIVPSDHMQTESKGKVHKLIIPKADIDDRAEYTVQVRDKTSKAPLFVEEKPLKIIKPLSERYNSVEGDTLTLVCEVNKPGVVAMWLKDGEQITITDGYEITVDGCRHILTIPDVTLDDEAEYTIMIGSEESTGLVLIEETAAGFTHRLSDTDVNEGEMIQLECTLSRPDVKVRWLKNRKPLTPSDRIKILCDRYRHVLQIMEAIPEDEGEYTIEITENIESSAAIRIRELTPSFIKKLMNKISKEKDSVILECELNKPNIPVRWLKDGVELVPSDRIRLVSDGNIHRLIIDDATLEDSGTYTCVYGSVTTEATLGIDELPAEFKRPLKDITAKEEDQVILECELSKPNKPVKWTKDGKDIVPDDHIHFSADLSTHQMSIDNVSLDDKGDYTCVCGDVATEAKLIIQELPTGVKKPLKDVTVKEKEQVILECELTRPNKPVKWFKDNKEIQPDEHIHFNVDMFTHQLVLTDVNLHDTGVYKLVCGDVSTEAKIVVEELPTEFTKPLADVTVTEKETVCLECEVSKANKPGKWFKNGQEMKQDDNVKFVTYDKTHRLIIKSAVLDDEAEYTVEVDGQTSKSQLYVEEGPVEFLRPLKEVQVMEKEPATLECEVNKPDLVAKWFLDDQEITGSDRVELVVYSTIHQLILHSTSLEDEGKYSVTIEGAKCATTLLVDEPPAELVTCLHDLIVPEKGTAVFECEVSRPWARANWFKDGEPITVSDGYDIRVDGTRHLLYLPKISKEDVGRYTVKIDDKETTARLRVKELPLKIVKPLQKVEVSEKEQVILTCEVNKPNIKAKWFKDKEEVETSENIHITTQETVHTLKITEATLEDAGLYKFQIEDKYSQAKVKVQELPLQFTKPLSDIEVTEGQEATLECVVSRADLPAKWLCKGKPLPKDNRITTTCDKNAHKLVMQSVTMDDQNEYSVKIGDKVSKAKLFVEEEAVEFVRKLTDVEVHEIPSKAIFECELSKPNITAKWFKDNKALPSDKKYKMVVEGPVHRLEISDVDGEDEGDYSIIARGKNSEAELIVEVAPELFLDKNFQESITLKAGQSTAFEIPFKGNPQPKVIWTFNDGELPKDKRLETQTIHNMTTMRLAKAKRPDAGNYKLTLENPRGKTSVDIKMIVLDKPSPPQNLTAPEILADSITLKWEAPEDNGGSDITGYLIEKREFNRRSWQEVEKVKNLEYTVGKLLEGNQYYFRVFAQNEIGMSEPIEFKEPITAKNPFTVPDAPEAPTASDITATSCTVSWQPPANDGGAPITGYQLERQSGFSPRWAPVNKDLIEGITYDLSDLVEDNTYIFRVKAVNKAGPSNPSEPSETYKAKNPWTKPGKPEAPEIMGTDNSSVALKWAPPAEDGGAPITNYVIEYKPVDAFRWLKANETQTVMETTFSVTGLKEGSQLEFRVAAQNKAGVGEASEPTKPVKVEAPLVGEAPKLLEPLQDTTIVSPNDATLECDLLLGEPEAEITWFKGKKEVKKSPKYEMSYEDEVAGLTIHQTKPDDAGVYSCQATNIIGQVQTEGTLSVHTLPQLDYDNKLKSKQSIKAGGSLSLTVNISGIPSPKVAWLLNGETIEKSPRLTMETTEEFSILTIKNATLEDAGNYKITAENVVGKAEADFEVVVKDKPSKPNNLSVPEVQKDSALLSWEQPTDTGGCDITDYIIEKRDAKRNTWTPVDKVDRSTFSYNVMKLLEGNEYYFRVIAKNEIGSSEPAEMDKGTVAKSPFDVPDAPQNLQPSEITKSSMTLTWEQPENNGGSPVIGYMVERKPADSTRWTKVNKKSLSDTMFTAMDLVEGSKYQFRVSAENAAGIGKPSQPTGPILAKNQFEKPDAPRQPEITEVTKNSISLKWVAPEKDGGSPIFNYVIESKPPRSHKWVPVTHNIQVPDCAFTVKDLTEGFEYEFRVLAENKAGLSKPSPSTGPVLAKEPIIGEAPSVLEGIPDVSVLLGEATTLECKINGQPQPSVEWSKDNKTIPSTKKYETSYDNMVASLTLREVTEKDAGTYKCEASNDLGSVSTSGQLEVQAAPKLEYDNKFRDLITLRSGTSLRIPVTVSGIPKPSVTWCKDDQTIKPSSRLNLDTTPTGSTLQVKKATREDDGMYAIMAENEAGDAKATFDVEVTDIPGPPEGPIEVTDLLKDSVTLSWQPPKDDGGSDIKQYNVDMREQNRSQWTKVGSVKAPTTTLTPSRLMDGKQYMFRVTAENDIGVSKPLETSESIIPKSPFGRFGYATRIDKSLVFNINSMMS